MNPKSFWLLPGLLFGALLGFSGLAAEIHDAIRAGDLARVRALGQSDSHQLELADGRAGQPPLHMAAELGRTNILKYLLEQKVPVDSTNYLGQTALHYVDFVGNRSSPEEIYVTVQILIANGANVNAVDRTDETPLHYFAADGQMKLAEMALERGAKVSYGNGHPNGTPLVQAARRGRDQMIQFLLSHGANADETDSARVTALGFAATYGHVAVMQILLDRGAKIDAADDNGSTPLHHAVDLRHTNAVELLLARHANTELENSYGQTPLGLCLSRKDDPVSATMAEALRKNGAKSTGSSKWKGNIEHAVVLASMTGKDDKLKEVLAAQPDLVNSKNSTGDTPLHAAVTMPRPAVVELLLKSGADVNATNSQGRTSLHVAAAAGSVEVARILWRAKADLEAKDHEGDTPLHLAASTGHADVAEFLVAMGAPVSGKDKKGLTPLDIARKSGNQRLIQILSAPKKEQRA